MASGRLNKKFDRIRRFNFIALAHAIDLFAAGQLIRFLWKVFIHTFFCAIIRYIIAILCKSPPREWIQLNVTRRQL